MEGLQWSSIWMGSLTMRPAWLLGSPYVQHFCGEADFRHELPLDQSSMTNWRKGIGAEKFEVLLALAQAKVSFKLKKSEVLWIKKTKQASC
jgi:hypothetical protein